MSDIFISYARSTAAQAQTIAEALRALGYGVWRDNELPAHRAYAEVIQERLKSAKAVVVIWSDEAVRSEWVQSEADRARADRKLVQLSIDGAELPMPFDRIQCADMTGWAGDLDSAGWRKVVASVAALVGDGAPGTGTAAKTSARKLSICVLPFVNMSGDAEQEYFSDGISEDIITDLAKVSALEVVSRNSAFRYKGQNVDLPKVARELSVRYVLEGSVRKAGSRVRITAQLIDGASGNHLWADRYDRELTDIFALQDEISEAIVGALKLKLLPEEKAAIEQRGTNNVDAYNLYLMARRYDISGNYGDIRRDEAIIRLCRRAVEIDPAYAQAWTLLALAQCAKKRIHGGDGDGGWAAAETALTLNPALAEAHAVKSRLLIEAGRLDEAEAETLTALRLDPESREANMAAAGFFFTARRVEEAIVHFEKATALIETEANAPTMLITCYQAIGDADGVLRSARTTLTRAERILAQDENNGVAMSYCVAALMALGETGRAKDWMTRALLIDPDNQNMRYNFACALAAHAHDLDGALDLLGPFLETATRSMAVNYIAVDPDLDLLRGDPRFQAMMAAAEARLAAADPADGTAA